MDLSVLQSVYQHEGPFATVYLEARSPSEDAAQQTRLRWNALRERLESAGADGTALDAIGAELEGATPGEEQTNGRVLVAASGAGVVLDDAWDAAMGAGDDAHWGVLPELGAYARERARAVRALVVRADQQGADVRRMVVAERHQPRGLSEETVEGSASEGVHKGVHKPRTGALRQKAIQRRADEVVQQNAKEMAEHLRHTVASFRPEVLVLAGAVKARTALQDELPGEVAQLVVETDSGGERDERASDEALEEELLRIAGELSQRDAEERVGQLDEGEAHGRAVRGDARAMRAAEMGAVDTLLLESGASTPREALLLKSCAGTNASLALVPEDTQLIDGVAALLRFPLEG